MLIGIVMLRLLLIEAEAGAVNVLLKALTLSCLMVL